MADKQRKVIVVVGGTGRTGRPVALSLHDNPEFQVKVTSRDPKGARATRISDAGIEVVKANSWEVADLDEAFRGAWGVYLNINSDVPEFWDGDGPKEFQMGKNVIESAIRQGVQNFVFAGLPEAERISNGAIRVLSFQQKNAISKLGQGAGFSSFVNVNVGWQMENFWNPAYEKPFGGFARVLDSEGFRTMRLFPMGNNPESTPFTSLRDDYGDIVHGVFLNPKEWDGKTVWAVSDPVSFQHVADTYNKVSGTQEARYLVQDGGVAADNPKKAEEVGGVRAWTTFVKGDYCDGKPLDQSDARVLKANGAGARGPHRNKELQTIEGFIRAYAFTNEDM